MVTSHTETITTAAIHDTVDAETPGRCPFLEEVSNTRPVRANAPIPPSTPNTPVAHRARAVAPPAAYRVPPTVSISVQPRTAPQASSAFFSHRLSVVRRKFPASRADSDFLPGAFTWLSDQHTIVSSATRLSNAHGQNRHGMSR